MSRILKIESVKDEIGGQVVVGIISGDAGETALLCKCQLPNTERDLTPIQVAELLHKPIDEATIAIWETSTGQRMSQKTFCAFLRELLGRVYRGE